MVDTPMQERGRVLTNASVIKHPSEDGFWYFSAFILLAFYYLAYRYPLQINSSTTSPTYSDTPFFLQIFKYTLTFLFVACSFLRPTFVPVSKNFLWLLGCLLVFPVIVAMLSYSSLSNGAFYVQQLVDACFFLVLLVPVMLGKFATVDISRLSKYFTWFYFISLLVLILQIVLFVLWGRLPALAWAGSVSVRFGSVWDDPNAFPMMLSFFLPFFALKWRFWGKSFLLAIIFLGVVLSAQSLTCLVSLFVGGIITLGLYKVSHHELSSLFLHFILFFVVFLLLYLLGENMFSHGTLPFQDVISEWIYSKQGSIYARQRLLYAFYDASFFTLLGVSPLNVWGEAAWLNMIVNLGVFYACAYASFLLMGIYMAARMFFLSETLDSRAFYLASFCFILSFALSLWNLPNNQVFPLNVICYLLWSVVFVNFFSRKKAD